EDMKRSLQADKRDSKCALHRTQNGGARNGSHGQAHTRRPGMRRCRCDQRVERVVDQCAISRFDRAAHDTRTQQFCFYASYHQNPVNQWIHIACVWPILLTAVVFFSYTPAIAGITIAGFALNWALILSALYAGYYVYLERPVGVVAAV